jgi:hypothetical protein
MMKLFINEIHTDSSELLGSLFLPSSLEHSQWDSMLPYTTANQVQVLLLLVGYMIPFVSGFPDDDKTLTTFILFNIRSAKKE